MTQEDLNNLKKLHSYAIELENTLNQLSVDINDGRISWGELTKKGSSVFFHSKLVIYPKIVSAI